VALIRMPPLVFNLKRGKHKNGDGDHKLW